VCRRNSPIHAAEVVCVVEERSRVVSGALVQGGRSVKNFKKK